MDTKNEVNQMRKEITESISRMTKDDCKDVQVTFNLKDASKTNIQRNALADEDIAEYVLMY